MNLGEQIYQLRTRKNLSQGDLADKLDVSRQSISKWENNVTTPELDKLVKMSELFGVSLDALVHGDDTKSKEKDKPETVVERVVVVEKHSKTAGVVLLGIGGALLLLFIMLGGDWMSLFFVAPFFICGIICLVAKQHRILLCMWGLYLSVFQYLRFATGITFAIVLQTSYFEPSWNYMRLIIGWVMLLLYLILTAASLWFTRKETLLPIKQNVLQTIALYLIIPLKGIVDRGLLRFIYQNDLDWNYGPRALIAVMATIGLASLAWALVRSISILRGKPVKIKVGT